MTATAEPPVPAVDTSSHPPSTRSRGEGVSYLAPGDGVELLGPIHGSGYRDGAALVRRGDGQMVQLGPLMYALLGSAEGRGAAPELATPRSERPRPQVDGKPGLPLAE